MGVFAFNCWYWMEDTNSFPFDPGESMMLSWRDCKVMFSQEEEISF